MSLNIKSIVMKTYTTQIYKKINILFFLFFCISIYGQNKTTLPNYLGEKSENLISLIQNNMEKWKNDSGVNPIENVISIASNDYRSINYNGAEQPNTIENLSQIPESDLNQVNFQIINEILNNKIVLNEQEIEFWSVFKKIINLPFAEVHIGKTYGDPHIVTFDGYRYSFQTVGEYTLCTNKKGNFDIQVRQEAVNESVSLNTATAINVNGDTICIYAKNHPDVYTNQPIRLNGEIFKMKKATTLLRNGGIIKIKGSSITVIWPTGEEATVRLAGNSLNVVPKVFSSNYGEYFGLLGNANGNPIDDLISFNGNVFKTATAFYKLADIIFDSGIKKRIIKAEKAYQAKLITNFGNTWRINDSSSLFIYGPNENTLTYTDYSFPLTQFSLAEVDKREINIAKKECLLAGVNSLEMMGCISDIIVTKDNSFAKEAALLSNIKILQRNFNTHNPIRKSPTLETVLKREIEEKEVARIKEKEEKKKNRNTFQLGNSTYKIIKKQPELIRVMTSDEVSPSEKPIKDVKEKLPAKLPIEEKAPTKLPTEVKTPTKLPTVEKPKEKKPTILPNSKTNNKATIGRK